MESKDLNLKAKQTIADNYECATALDRYDKLFLDPLQVRMDNAHKMLFEGGYRKECEKKKIKPDPEVEKKMQQFYDENGPRLHEMKNFYNAVRVLINRHEGVINELARVYVGIRDKVMWKGEIPAQLMREQQAFLKEYFESIQKILEPCGLDQKD